MATPRATTFLASLALVPPAAVLVGFYQGWAAVTQSSLVLRTLAVVVYGFVLFRYVFEYFTSPLRHLPAPRGDHFLLGHGMVMLDKPRGSTLFQWMKTIPNDGLIHFRGFLQLRSTLLLTTPETVMEVLNAHSYDWEKPAPARRFLRRVLGDGLINVEGNEHKRQRRNVTPAFSGKVIKDLIPLFWSKGEALVAAVKRESSVNSGGAVELSDLASRVTLDIIGAAGLGKDFETISHAEHELAQQYSLITSPRKGNLTLYFFINMFFPQSLVRRLPFKANARVAQAVVVLRRITRELLAEKKQAMADKTVEQKDIIALLMRSGKFTSDELTDQLLTFLAAGHETTSAALTWTAYLLCKNPEVKARLQTEVRHVCDGLDAADITDQTLERMPYLDAVCNETLRVYPTVPITSRCAAKATRIGEVAVPAGTFVVLCPWALNRLPSLWGADAETFRPERWLGAEGKHGGARSPYAFITFLHGPRSCIGQAFARTELKCLLAALMLHTDFELQDPGYVAEPVGAVTIKPKEGLFLHFKSRELEKMVL